MKILIRKTVAGPWVGFDNHARCFRNYRNKIFVICTSFFDEMKRVGWGFKSMEFSISVSVEDFLPDGSMQPESVNEKFRSAYQKEYMKLLNPRSLEDPDCKTPCLRTSPDKFFIWQKTDGKKSIINGRSY
jgi:hypothetical protein